MLDENRIQSAIARPYCGYYRSLHEKAAALVHGVVSNHGFIDGNKRTALYLVDLLLERSGFILTAPDEALVDLIGDIAEGELSVEDLTDWFKENIAFDETP